MRKNQIPHELWSAEATRLDVTVCVNRTNPFRLVVEIRSGEDQNISSLKQYFCKTFASGETLRFVDVRQRADEE